MLITNVIPKIIVAAKFIQWFRSIILNSMLQGVDEQLFGV